MDDYPEALKLLKDGINEYIVGATIAELQAGAIKEFGVYDYDRCARDLQVARTLPGEVFYSARNNKLLGRECYETIVAALNGTIYKVLFRYVTPEHDEFEAFRKDLVEYMTSRYGEAVEVKTISEIPSHKLAVWDTNFGNIVLDADFLGTSLIYTSGLVLRAAQPSMTKKVLNWIRNRK